MIPISLNMVSTIWDLTVECSKPDIKCSLYHQINKRRKINKQVKAMQLWWWWGHGAMWCSGGSGQILECSGKRSPLEPSSVCLLIHLSACLLLDPVLRCSSLSLCFSRWTSLMLAVCSTGGRVKTWKRRWFILTDNCLYYFEYTTVSTDQSQWRFFLFCMCRAMSFC